MKEYISLPDVASEDIELSILLIELVSAVYLVVTVNKYIPCMTLTRISLCVCILHMYISVTLTTLFMVIFLLLISFDFL